MTIHCLQIKTMCEEFKERYQTTKDICLERRSVRKYIEKDLPEGVLEDILVATQVCLRPPPHSDAAIECPHLHQLSALQDDGRSYQGGQGEAR